MTDRRRTKLAEHGGSDRKAVLLHQPDATSRAHAVRAQSGPFRGEPAIVRTMTTPSASRRAITSPVAQPQSDLPVIRNAAQSWLLAPLRAIADKGGSQKPSLPTSVGGHVEQTNPAAVSTRWTANSFTATINLETCR